jgi:hypothetical protein
MTAIDYIIVQDRSLENVQAKVKALLATHQPHGNLVVDRESRLYAQPMVSTGAATVTDGMELAAVEPTGSYTDTVTFTVVDGKITEIALS